LVLTGIVVTIAVLSAVSLVFLVLMHSGRGGGISDLLGGSLGSVAQGSTVVERNLDRFTVAVAMIFFFAVLTLDLRLQ
jgi:preprotein translocase subunit SecG